MRVFTVRQPWAWAIIHGGKDVENRTRSLGPYRGLVAIHAGLRWDHAAFDVIGDDLSERWGVTRENYTGDDLGGSGRIIGVVDLVGTHLGGVTGCHPDLSDPQHLAWCSAWAMPDHHHLELANPRPLARPIPATGRLGLWRPDADLEAAIRGQLERGGDDDE